MKHVNGPVVVLGGSGFVGSHVVLALGEAARSVRSPRLEATARDEMGLLREARGCRSAIVEIMAAAEGCKTMVIAAGLPDARGEGSNELFGANALLPVVAYMAAARAGCTRVIHVSSAVVQGNVQLLDSGWETRPFSAYSSSKELAERALRELAAQLPGPTLCVYRPPSVHAPSRRITKAIASLARSPLSATAAPGSAPTPQALAENVASVVSFLALSRENPPTVVHHPWEGITTGGLLRMLGNGRVPRLLWPRFAGLVARVFSLSLRRSSRFSAHSRRLDLLWFGQPQAQSWLTDAGWEPVAGRDRWIEIGSELAKS